MYTLIINSDNVVSGTNNSKYTYKFPIGAVEFKDQEVAVASVSIFYSWFNITAVQGNNTFSYIWYNSGGSTTYNLTIPDGFYTISTLNSWLQSEMVANGNYLVNSTGSYVYYLELVTNSTYYAIQFNSYPIPTSLPSGYTNPASMTFPSTASTPQLVINSGDNITNILGFTAGTYPSSTQSTSYSVLSSFTPQVTPVQSLILSCSLLNNRYANPCTLLYSFSPANTTFGSLIQITPPMFSWVDIQNGLYTDFTIQFLDQNFNSIVINDPNLVVMLTIRKKGEI